MQLPTLAVTQDTESTFMTFLVAAPGHEFIQVPPSGFSFFFLPTFQLHFNFVYCLLLECCHLLLSFPFLFIFSFIFPPPSNLLFFCSLHVFCALLLFMIIKTYMRVCVCVNGWLICGWTKLLAIRCLFCFYRPKGKCHKIHKGVGAMEEKVPQCCSTTGF